VKISYDPVDDILLITLKERALAYGEEITPQIIAHYSKDNELIEIEVLDANNTGFKWGECLRGGDTGCLKR